MNRCDQGEALRDYAFDELPARERREMEQHITACAGCAQELDQLRLTTAALRILPDREIPQRIAFVSDKVFAPSPLARFFKSSWAGLASAGVMAAALIFTVLHRPPVEIRTVMQTASDADVTKQIDDAVNKAVRQVRTENAQLTEDARLTKAALTAAEARHEQEHRLLMTEMEQLEVMEKRIGALTSLASLEVPQNATATGSVQ